MIVEFIITFRETLESALIVGIVLGFSGALEVGKTNKKINFNNP